MDRISRAVQRMWGTLDAAERLHGSPRFADELAAQCNGKLALRAPSVSKWSFGEQLEHLYRSSLYVLDRLEEAMSGAHADDKKGFWGYGMSAAGFIPRHMFPTIPPLEPQGGTIDVIGPLQEELRRRLAEVTWNLQQIKSSRGRSKHPRMKWLTSSEWLFFADIHHRHHLAIMRDIVTNARPSS